MLRIHVLHAVRFVCHVAAEPVQRVVVLPAQGVFAADPPAFPQQQR